jgi:dTDP-4-dehydrorhamnose 3,5-epimerase
MHFQTPPYDLDKLVTVLHGNVLDVILDMRKTSPTFGKTVSYYLGEEYEHRSLFIPSGCAHGFLSLCDQTLMLYQTTCEFHPEHDTGVRFDSIGFNWGISRDALIISEKDQALPVWDPQESLFQ